MGLPRYMAIAEQIRKRIISGELASNSQLPSQRELAEMHSTTLMTVRHALALLEEEGLIYSQHGVGTFVIGENLDVDALHLLSFRDEMKQRALSVETRLLHKGLSTRHTTAARILGLPPDAPLCMLERLRLVHTKPIVYQCSFLPQSVQPVVRGYSAEISLYNLFDAEAGQIVTMAKEVVIPTLLTTKQADLLECQANAPAFLARRVSVSLDGTPLVYDEAIMLGSRFVISTERLGQRHSFQYHVLDDDSPDILTLLTEES